MKIGKNTWKKVPGMPAGNAYYCIFGSTDDLWHVGDAELETLESINRDSRNTGNKGWCGTESWEEAYDLGALRGWPDGARKMREMRSRINALHLSLLGSRRKKIIKPVGSRVHIPRFVAGDHNHMFRYKKRRTGDGTHVRFGVECGMLGFVSAEQAANRGIAVAALLKVVEDTGISVDLIALHTASCKGGIMTCAHRVKKAGSYMNDERIAMALAHPSTHRRGAFAIRELWDDEFEKMVGNGYGSTRPTPAEVLKQMGIDHHITTIHADSMNWGSPSDKEIVGWVLRQFEAICTAKDIRAI